MGASLEKLYLILIRIMKYMGSKNKISKDIKEILDLNRTDLNQPYYEPMCGGCNMLDEMKGKRFASDNNKYLIALWQGLQQDLERPKKITRQMYDNAKKDFKNDTNLIYNNFLIGYIGFLSSFNGKFFNGFIGGLFDGRYKNKSFYFKCAIDNINAQFEYLKDVIFILSDYINIDYVKNSVIYFDIPYFDATKYKTGSFDYDKFYAFAEEKSKQGHKVFISEYWMPEDRFTKIWSKQIKSNLSNQTQNKIESLFIPKNQTIKQHKTLF